MSQRQQTKIPKQIMIASWAITLGAIAPMFDATMINIAIKQLNETFHSQIDIIQWTITGYVLALAIAVPIAGWLINRFNGKKIFINAMLLFGITSLLAGLSWSITALIIFRIAQGFSAGLITTLMFTLIVKIAGREHTGKVMAIVSTPMIFGPILGPVLGGVIIHLLSWRWIFFINIVILIIAIPLMIKYIPQFEPFNRHSKLDAVGIVILGLISTLFILGVSRLASIKHSIDMMSIVLISLAIILVGLYVLYNIKMNYKTILPITLFKSKSYSAASIGLLLANIGIMGPMLIIPLYFQVFKGYTTIETAIALIPQGVGMLITRPYIGKMIDQIGAKSVIIFSVIIAMFGSIPLLFITDDTSMWIISAILFIRGCSVGGINLGLTTDAYLGVDEQNLAEAGVGINIIENVGSSVGTAIIATVISIVMSTTHTTVSHTLTAYHAGFLVAVIAILLIIFPTLMLTSRKNSSIN